ncbi:MAG TPA: hypothetical protein VMA72_28565 [Streptosporangiaceae bacterium]|nr:hypothetical protein [Streptosporangiaceae bacterium]
MLLQYGTLFIPLVVAAVVATLFSTSLTSRLSAGDAYRVGLACGLVGMILLVATEWAQRAAFSYPLLLIATVFVGVGFGLSFQCVRCYVVSLKPLRARRQILLVNGLLAAGLVAAPVYALASRATSIWWSLPVVVSVLLIAQLLVSRSLCAPVDGLRALRTNRRVPVRFRVYPGLALLYGLCAVACLTAPHYLTGPLPSARHLHFLVLIEVAFWAALVQGCRVVFGIIDGMKSRQHVANIGVFMIAVVVFALSFSISRYSLMLVGIYLLAAVGCAALLPIDTRPGHEHLSAFPLAVTAGLLALFPAGLGLSRYGYNIAASDGVSSLELFLGVAAVGAAACLLLMPVLMNWRTMAYFEQPAISDAQPPSAGHSGATAMPGPPAAPQPRRPRDRPEDDSEGRKPGGATALPQGPQRGDRGEGRQGQLSYRRSRSYDSPGSAYEPCRAGPAGA